MKKFIQTYYKSLDEGNTIFTEKKEFIDYNEIIKIKEDKHFKNYSKVVTKHKKENSTLLGMIILFGFLTLIIIYAKGFNSISAYINYIIMSILIFMLIPYGNIYNEYYVKTADLDYENKKIE